MPQISISESTKTILRALFTVGRVPNEEEISKSLARDPKIWDWFLDGYGDLEFSDPVRDAVKEMLDSNTTLRKRYEHLRAERLRKAKQLLKSIFEK